MLSLGFLAGLMCFCSLDRTFCSLGIAGPRPILMAIATMSPHKELPEMSSEVVEVVLPEALEQARAQATEQGLPYAGGVRPTVAWALVQGGHATLDRAAESRDAGNGRMQADRSRTWPHGRTG